MKWTKYYWGLKWRLFNNEGELQGWVVWHKRGLWKATLMGDMLDPAYTVGYFEGSVTAKAGLEDMWFTRINGRSEPTVMAAD